MPLPLTFTLHMNISLRHVGCTAVMLDIFDWRLHAVLHHTGGHALARWQAHHLRAGLQRHGRREEDRQCCNRYTYQPSLFLAQNANERMVNVLSVRFVGF